MSLSSLSVAAVDYDEEGAYRECYTLYPDFINRIKAEGITEKQLMSFVKSVEKKVLEHNIPLTEENFDTLMFQGFKDAFGLRTNIKVRDALASVYPESVAQAMDGAITEEFMPIYITVKRFLLGITTPVVTLSGDKSNTLVHYVHMSEAATIFVAFYTPEGDLLKAYKNPEGEMECEGAFFAKAFAFEPDSLSPLCESFILNF